MSNAKRGEIYIELGKGEDKQKWKMRPTYTSLCEIEEIVKTPLFSIMDDLQSGAVSAALIRAIFWAGIRAGSEDPDSCPTLERVGELIGQVGLTNKVLIVTAGQFLKQATMTEADIKEADEKVKKGGPGASRKSAKAN